MTPYSRRLRRIVLRGKRTKLRQAALSELSKARKPSLRLLNELLSQPDLPDLLFIDVLRLRRMYYEEGR